jgi:hypothetical protein
MPISLKGHNMLYRFIELQSEAIWDSLCSKRKERDINGKFNRSQKIIPTNSL